MHPRADLLQQMPHPGEDKVVKCPTISRRGMHAFGIDEAITCARGKKYETLFFRLPTPYAPPHPTHLRSQSCPAAYYFRSRA